MARVIIADDSADMRSLVRSSLPEFSDVVEAEDGRQLFWHLLRASFGRGPDVIVIADVRMPAYDGLDVLDAWCDPDHPSPVIVITSFPDDEVRAKVARLGATLLPKPFSRATLRLVVDHVSRQHRSEH